MDALKILVVDDESRMRKLVKDFLIKKNFQVLEAGDGEEAMDIFYKENSREYSLLKTENFRTMLMMEVGALFVGKIENRPRRASVKRGEEKGNFAFGGSTIVLITEKNAVKPDEDILRNSQTGIETRVLMGEKIGESF